MDIGGRISFSVRLFRLVVSHITLVCDRTNIFELECEAVNECSVLLVLTD
jgi:hypothetical protein